MKGHAMKTNLTAEETLLLVDVLKEYLADLHSEIHDTDDFRFKKTLQGKEQALSVIVSKFEQELVAAYE